MIWMFITLGMTVSWLLTLFIYKNGGRNLLNSLYATAPMLLVEAGAAVCLMRGTLNLALPGTACLSGVLAAAIMQGDGSPASAILAAILMGTVLGALNGLFAIQSRKKIVLVTGIASLILGSCYFAFAGLAVDYRNIVVRTDREAVQVLCWIGLVIAAAVCILSGLGKGASPETGEDGENVSGGTRFLWTMIAGALAGLAGVVMVIRIGAASISNFSSCNESYILPTLIFAGMLIPNLRRSRGESVLGMLSVVLAGLCVGFIATFMSINSFDSGTQRIVMGVASALLLIPNILIGHGRKPEKQDTDNSAC